MVCFDLPVKRCERDHAWLSQPLLLSSMQNLKVWKSGRFALVTITSDASYMYVLICRYCFLANNLEISICCHLVQGEFRALNTQILYLLRSIYLHPNIMNLS